MCADAFGTSDTDCAGLRDRRQEGVMLCQHASALPPDRTTGTPKTLGLVACIVSVIVHHAFVLSTGGARYVSMVTHRTAVR